MKLRTLLLTGVAAISLAACSPQDGGQTNANKTDAPKSALADMEIHIPIQTNSSTNHQTISCTWAKAISSLSNASLTCSFWAIRGGATRNVLL